MVFLFLSGHEFQTGNVSNILLEDVMENVNTETRQRISLLTIKVIIIIIDVAIVVVHYNHTYY